jgi:SAM-dependent methyltransferase
MISSRLVRLWWGSRPVVTMSPVQRRALQDYRDKVHAGDYRLERTPCLCGSDGGLLLGRRDRYGLPVKTRLCKQCGVLRTDPRLDEASLKRFYAENYRKLYVGEPVASDEFFSRQVAHGREILASLGGGLPNVVRPVVYDIGCGAGGVLLPFQETGWRAYGCDLGGHYLERGRSTGLQLFEGAFDALASCPPADLIILSHVLEHVGDPGALLGQITDRLARGGMLHVELPGIYAIEDSYVSVLHYLQNAHLYHYTLDTLTNLMAEHGYVLVTGDERIVARFVRVEAGQETASRPVNWRAIYRHVCHVETESIPKIYYDFMRRYPGINRVRVFLGRGNRKRLWEQLKKRYRLPGGVR